MKNVPASNLPPKKTIVNSLISQPIKEPAGRKKQLMPRSTSLIDRKIRKSIGNSWIRPEPICWKLENLIILEQKNKNTILRTRIWRQNQIKRKSKLILSIRRYCPTRQENILKYSTHMEWCRNTKTSQRSPEIYPYRQWDFSYKIYNEVKVSN